MSAKQPDMIEDMGKGFGRFVDDVLRGHDSKLILNSSIGLASLEMGIPSEVESWTDLEPAAMVVNNLDFYGPNMLLDHPLFHFAAPTAENTNGFTLFGLDFHDFWNQLAHGAESNHHTPFYEQSLAESIGLPNLPYGEIAHFAHIGLALYDTGRTFQEVWKELGDYYEKNDTNPMQQGLSLAAHMGKTITHPDMLHIFAARGVMLTVMGLLHPLGPLVSLGVAYLSMHLVHSFFGLMEHNKDAIRQIENVPVLSAIYNASGLKEWAERGSDIGKDGLSEPERIDPFAEPELAPGRRELHGAHGHGRLQEHLEHLQPKTP